MWAADETFLREVLLTAFERRRFQTEVINAMPLYPTEAVLWDENQVPSTHYTGGDYEFIGGISSQVINGLLWYENQVPTRMHYTGWVYHVLLQL